MTIASWIALIASCGWLYWGLILFYHGTYDDVYISQRYADNLAAGEGYAFNRGEAVEGASNPLWVFLIAACRCFGMNGVFAAKVAGAACALLLPVVAVALAVGMAPDSPPVIAGWLVGLSAPLAMWGVNGLETPAYALAVTLGLMCGAADLTRLHGWPRAAPAFAAAAWLRPEGPLLAVPYLLAMAWRARHHRGARRATVQAWGIVAGGVGLLVAWRFALFGVLLPNTYYAKLANPEIWPGGDGRQYVIRGLAGAGGVPLLCGMAAAFVMRGVVLSSVRLTAATVLCQICFIWWTGGDWMDGYRFWVPVLPACLTLAAVGAGALWRTAAPSWGTGGRWLVAACACWLTIVHAIQARDPLEEKLGGYTTALMQGHGRVAQWLRDRVSPGTLLAIADAGYVPWFTRLPTVDLLGLNDAFIARHPPRACADYVIERRRPGVVVLAQRDHRGVWPLDRLIAARSDFERGWRQVTRVNFPAYDLVVYLRRDLSLLPRR